MDIRLITRHLDRTQALVDHTQRRAGYALSRFSDIIRTVDIRLSDVNGPRGGNGITCMARLRLVGGGDVLVESAAVSPEDGITLAVTRLANRLARVLSRRQDH